MAFTYDLSTTGTPLLISQVRFELGDTASGVGIKPDGSNLTDEEITMLLTQEGYGVMRAVTRACFTLARMWSVISSTSSPSYSEQAGKVAGEWQARGEGNVKMGYGPTGRSGMRSSSMKRSDGYTRNNPQLNDQDGVPGEYNPHAPIFILP